MDKLIFILAVVALSCRADSSLLVWLTFENDFTTSLHVNDQSQWTNNAYCKPGTGLTMARNYAPLRTTGKFSPYSVTQTNFGEAEYAALVVSGGGDTNDFPGYVEMSYLAVTNNGGGLLANMANGTVALWVYPTQRGAENTSMTWVSAGWTDVVDSWALSNFHNESSSHIAFTVYTNTATNPQRNPVEFPAIPIDGWMHLAVTWNAGADQVKAYTNGILTATGTMAAPFYKVGSWVGLQVLTHGDQPFETYRPNNGWAGNGSSMDDFRIYNRTLTAAEIMALTVGGPITIISNAAVKTAGFK